MNSFYEGEVKESFRTIIMPYTFRASLQVGRIRQRVMIIVVSVCLSNIFYYIKSMTMVKNLNTVHFVGLN